MKYTSQFVNTIDRYSHLRDEAEIKKMVEYQKAQAAAQLGKEIAKIIDFSKESNPVEDKYTLEVVVFPYDAWRNYKDLLRKYIEVAAPAGLGTFNLIVFGKMIKELEEGKPITPPVETTGFKPNTKYTAHHIRSGEEWVILGISPDLKKVCVAGWPPTIADFADCKDFKEAGELSVDEYKYRQREFGENWI